MKKMGWPPERLPAAGKMGWWMDEITGVGQPEDGAGARKDDGHRCLITLE